MGAQLGGSGSFSDINMTPLIDIVLVVLIIMMVNIPIQIEQMGVKLPSNIVTPPTDTPSDQLVIALYADGQIALNRRAMPEQKVLFELQRRLRPIKDKRVFVDADQDVEYGQVIDLVDLAYEAGASKVGLAKLKPEGPRPITSVDPGGMPKGLHFNSPTVRTEEGDIDEIRADAAIQVLKPKLEGCYAKSLILNPSLTGHLNIITEVGPQGELLSDPRIEGGEMDDSDLKTCVEVVMKGIKYKPLGPQKTAAIRYGILFSPG